MSFPDMIATLFADPLLSKPATYQPQNGAGSVAVTVMTKQPDVLTGFGGGHVHTETALFQVQAKDVPQPAVGDQLMVDGVVYLVQSEPIADGDRLIWTLNVVPQ